MPLSSSLFPAFICYDCSSVLCCFCEILVLFLNVFNNYKPLRVRQRTNLINYFLLNSSSLATISKSFIEYEAGNLIW